MKNLFNVVLALALFALGSQAFAQTSDTFIDGEQLYKYCTSTKLAENNTCAGYIGGVLDTMTTLTGSDVIKKLICIPVNVKLSTIRDVLVSYLKKHPEELGLNASSLILDPLVEAYPCSP